MISVGIPAGGFKTVGQLVGTNGVTFRTGQTALAVAIEMLSAHISGAPVVDPAGACVGFISEVDILKTLDAKHDLLSVKAEDIMTKLPIAVRPSTTIAEAVKLMEDHHVLNLPVERDGKILFTLTRHDLLRALIGIGMGIEE